MDLMDIRRALMMLRGGTMAQAKSGTFTGDSTITTVLDIGFEPDVIVIDSGLDLSVAGWQGLACVVIIKDVLTFNYYHNSTTDTNERTYNSSIKSNQDQWGASSGAYRNYAIFSDGKMTVTNKTNNANVSFVNGQNYSWTAYKK